jgi:hypothetical protein
MVETLEFMIRQAAEHPRHARVGLFKELLRSETFLLTVDEPIAEESVTRVSHADETLPVWADKDPELGGVWVPVFPSRDSVSGFVSKRKLKAPKGQEFLWMGHQPGAIFALLRGVPCFAGMRLHLDHNSVVDVPWSQVRELSEGRVPTDGPELYDMPVARLTLPRGMKLAFGTCDAGPEQPRAKLLCLPDAGHFKVDDTRKLVRLPLADGPAWMACRHFLQVLKYLKDGSGGAKGPGNRYVEDLLCSLMSFQMFGEAEALCVLIIEKGGEMYGWLALAAIYGRTGRLSECAELCVRASERYPDETAFPLNGARALVKLDKKDEAAGMLQAALERQPTDARLRAALDELR